LIGAMPLSADYSAIILAAGRSSRMGSDKSGLPWLGGRPLLRWLADELAGQGWEPIAVLGPENYSRWRAELPQAVLNPHPELGKTTSLRAGLGALSPKAQWILVTAVDQPRLPAVYRALRTAAYSHPGRILVPDRSGHRGHPVVLHRCFLTELLALSEAALGLRGFLDAHYRETFPVPCGDAEGLAWDLNTREAYTEALAYFGKLAPDAPLAHA